MKTKQTAKSATRVRQGRRNRQRGAELQRETVRICNSYSLISFNRDRGGANHEKGDVEIEGHFYGCKRKKSVPRYILPEKEEIGVVFRGDRMKPMISIPLDRYLLLLSLIKHNTDEELI